MVKRWNYEYFDDLEKVSIKRCVHLAVCNYFY